METFCGFVEFASRDTIWKCKKKLNMIIQYDSIGWLIARGSNLWKLQSNILTN